LREMGVGDISVGKKVRKMAEVFYGRVAAYDRALASTGAGDLESAISRNLFPDTDPGQGPERLAGYVLDQRGHLAAQDVGALAQGAIRFKEPSP
jgi:cytochrome b pre-mRNA-processing protein 3